MDHTLYIYFTRVARILTYVDNFLHWKPNVPVTDVRSTQGTFDK